MGFVYKIICQNSRDFNSVPTLLMSRDVPSYLKSIAKMMVGELESLLGPDKTNDEKILNPDNEKSAERLHAEKTNACTNCCNNMTLRDYCVHSWRSFGCDTGDCDCAPEIAVQRWTVHRVTVVFKSLIT